MERPRCRTCPYWFWEQAVTNFDDWNDDSPLVDGDFNALNGTTAEIAEVEIAECIRHAPLPIVRVPGSDHGNCGVQWPETEHYEVCGEHPDFPAYIESLKPTVPPADRSRLNVRARKVMARAEADGVDLTKLGIEEMARRLVGCGRATAADIYFFLRASER